MKKYLLIILAFGAIISCSKDELKVSAEEEKPITFTAAPLDGGDTKTYLVTGKVNWIEGDVVMISNGTETKKYVVEDDGKNNNRYATLTPASGVTGFTSKDETYTATYGNVNDQWYDSAKGCSHCPMEASGAKPEKDTDDKYKFVFEFKNSCGVVEVNACTGENVIAKIIIGSYTLNFLTPKKLEGTESIWVAVNPITDSDDRGPYYSFQNVTFVKTDGSKLTKTLTSAAKVHKNEKRKMDTKSAFNGDYNSGCEPVLLPGVFKVSDTEYVQFTRGNIYCNASQTPPIWGFESEQYEGRPNNKSYNANHVSHFYYRSDYGYTEKASSGSNVSLNWGSQYTSHTFSERLQTLTKGQWQYMLQSDKGGAKYCMLKLSFISSDCWGVLLLPSNFIWNESTMGTEPSSYGKWAGSGFDIVSGSVTLDDIAKFRVIEQNGGVLFMAYGTRTNTGVDYFGGVSSAPVLFLGLQDNSSCFYKFAGGLPSFNTVNNGATTVRLVVFK